MIILSINVGRPREVEWHGDIVTTSIFKTPVAGTVSVRPYNIDGDEQADLSVHGGPDKSVYLYPSEHYAFWREELDVAELPPGAFGENLTAEGVLESEMNIGDMLRIGSAVFVVTQPRMPCLKLNIRFGRADMVKRFLASGRSGLYLRVVEAGEMTAGDAIEILERDPGGVTVTDIVRLYTDERDNAELLRRALGVADLPDGWRSHFRERLSGLDA